MAYWLPEDIITFPRPELADEDGLLAGGGDLSIRRLLMAYHFGIFPWYAPDEPILWYSPHQRCVIFPDKLKISKSLQQILRSNKFEVTHNKAFKKVLEACANTPRKNESGTWLNNDLQQAFTILNRMGWAHSLEVWHNQQLVGGLYGMVINNVFAGESMFSLMSNASKVAMVYLCKNMYFKMIDCQIPNNHLMSLGAEMITRDEFMTILKPK